MSINHLKNAIAPATQREALPGQAQNSAGGFSYVLTDMQRLERFLILGTEGGTYYASEQKLSRENAKVVERLAQSPDAMTALKMIVDVSESGRAPKNDPAVLALAIFARLGFPDVRRAAYAAIPKVCRIGTHLYHFVQFADQLGGWGRGLRTAVAKWFNEKPATPLALQIAKYQQRDGWSARDLLRLSHAKPPTADHVAIYKYITAGYDDAVAGGSILPPILDAIEELKKDDVALPRALHLIEKYRVPRECIPTPLLNKREVWEALLPHMGVTAMIRNLGKMTNVGLLGSLCAANVVVTTVLNDKDQLRKQRVHPMTVLTALMTYQSGHGVKGKLTWSPVQQVVDALDAAFYASFRTVTPTNKPTLIALDVSGSMSGGTIAGVPNMSPRVASAAMALITAATEPTHAIVGFSHHLVDISISPNMRLDQAIAAVSGIPFGRTDCALPFTWALTNKKHVESFALYTDNETWCGNIHPSQAIKDYRRKTGVEARSAVVGMTATQFTIADPSDPGMMDFVGFDASAPAIMADFFRGGIGEGSTEGDSVEAAE